MLFLAAWFGIQRAPTEMGLTVVAGAVGVFCVNLDKFEVFRAAGIEAKMRKLVTKAEVTIDQLREVASTMLATNLRLMTWSNRLGGMPQREQIERVQQALRLQKDLGISSSDIDGAVEVFYRMLIWDRVHRVLSHYWRLGKRNAEIEKMQARINARGSDFPVREELEAIAEFYEKPIGDAAIKLIDDYIYFRDNRVIRPGFEEPGVD